MMIQSQASLCVSMEEGKPGCVIAPYCVCVCCFARDTLCIIQKTKPPTYSHTSIICEVTVDKTHY